MIAIQPIPSPVGGQTVLTSSSGGDLTRPTQPGPLHIRAPRSFLALPLLVLGGVLLTACPKKQVVEEKPTVIETQTVGNLKKEAIDLNNDKRPDIWNYSSTEGRSRLVRKESDLNFDGKVDVTSHFEAGQVVKEEVDADFDGKIDWTDYYGEGGKRTRQELDTDFDGELDTWRYFDAGVLIRKERDTDGNGKPDYFEHYENDQVTRTGRDTDNDGKEDTWDTEGPGKRSGENK